MNAYLHGNYLILITFIHKIYRPGSGGVAYVGDATSDPLLSVILDEVMDIVPETYNPENSELINLINSMDSQAGQQSPSNQQQNTYQVNILLDFFILVFIV